MRDLPPDVLPFLMPSRYCPSDQFAAFVRSQFGPRGAPGRAQAALEAKRIAAARAGGPRVSRAALGSEVGLARHESPHRGERLMAMSRILIPDMPCTLAALEAGRLSEHRTELITKEAACLSAFHRQLMDAELCGDPATVEGMGNKEIEAEAKREGLRQADEQIAKSVAENEADAKREIAGLLNKRQAREQSTAVAQKARVSNETTKRKAPEYGNWASAAVPQSVIDELRAGAEAANGVRGSTGDKQPVVAVRAESPAATGQDGQRPTSALPLGPARRG